MDIGKQGLLHRLLGLVAIFTKWITRFNTMCCPFELIKITLLDMLCTFSTVFFLPSLCVCGEESVYSKEGCNLEPLAVSQTDGSVVLRDQLLFKSSTM